MNPVSSAARLRRTTDGWNGGAKMLYPKEKMSYTPVYKGNKSQDGWIVLDIGNIELDGVTKVYIDLKDIEDVKVKKSAQEDALDKARKLLGGE